MSDDSSSGPGLKLREQDLAGKVAVVTGASRGIGRGIALNLASRGCSILGTCSGSTSLHLIDSLEHSVSDLYTCSSHVASAPKVIALAADILDRKTPVALADAIASNFDGHVDIFVNNASQVETAKVGQISDEHIQKYLMGNIEVPVKTVEEFVKRRQFRKNSRIIVISSIRARKAWADQ